MPLSSFLPWSRRKRLTSPAICSPPSRAISSQLTFKPFTWRGGCGTRFLPSLTGGTSSHSSRSQINLRPLASDGGASLDLGLHDLPHDCRRQEARRAFGKESLRVVVGFDDRRRQPFGLVVKQIVIGIEARERVEAVAAKIDEDCRD